MSPFGTERVVMVSTGTSWLARCIIATVGAVVIVLALVVLIPLGLVLLAIGVLAAAVWLIKSKFRRAKQPNGVLDGRRNVRVRVVNRASPVEQP